MTSLCPRLLAPVLALALAAPLASPAHAGDVYDRAAPTIEGPVGLMHAITPDTGPGGSFRVGLHLGGFQENSFLISGSGTQPGDTDQHFFGNLELGYTPWRYLELYLTVFTSTNKNSRTDPGRTDPPVIVNLGDLAFGVKGHYPLGRFFDVGAHAGVKLLNSVSGISFAGDTTGFSGDALASVDLRPIRVPLRLTVNGGWLLDNSLSLLPELQCAASAGNDACIRSRVVETFAYGIGASRARVVAALDAPLQLGPVGLQPMFEYHLEVATGSGDATVSGTLKSDPAVPAARIDGRLIQYLTAGVRVRPVAGLIVDAGVDLGLQSPGFQFGSPVPAWNVLFGIAYAYAEHPAAAPARVVTRVVTHEVTRPAPVTRVAGVVRDAATRAPIAGATVKYVDRPVTAELTGEDGSFVSADLAPGTVQLAISRDGYTPATASVQVAAGHEAPVAVLLTAKPAESGQIKLKVTDENGKAFAATVHLTSASGAIIEPDILGAGLYGARLPPGQYGMEIGAPGYVDVQKIVPLEAGQVQSLDVQLRKKPTMSHVKVTAKEIAIKGTIHFATGTARIMADGQEILDEVAEAMREHPEIKKVRIEGHTDNRGRAQHNLTLSKQRALAAMNYLIGQGIDPARLESEGYGASQPLVPNITPANRAKNRRVTFRILERAGG